jgi:hypothetical protein
MIVLWDFYFILRCSGLCYRAVRLVGANVSDEYKPPWMNMFLRNTGTHLLDYMVP